LSANEETSTIVKNARQWAGDATENTTKTNTTPEVTVLKNRQEILSLAIGGDNDFFEVAYDIEGRGIVVEATVSRCKNGLAINYTEKYMRRRDPDCMVIGDDEETDKTYFKELFNKPFDGVRSDTFEWLKKQETISGQ